MGLVVTCVWVRGNVDYDSRYPIRLQSMVRRHLSRPHEFVCLTDRPGDCEAAGVKPKFIRPYAGLAGWWNKVQLFRDGMFPAGARVIYLDLDSIVVGDLGPIVDFPAPFALVGPGGAFRPRGHQTIIRFNSSVMAFDVGAGAALAAEFPALQAANLQLAPDRKPLWGDQDWIGHRMPDAATMPGEWFPRLSECSIAGPPPSARVVLCKKPKNHVAAREMRWVAEAWH